MSLKKQTLWSMLPLLVVTVVNIVSVPLFLRFLGPERYALWFYVLTFTGAFGFMDLGLGVAVGRYMGVALGKGDTVAVREYWGTGNAIVLPLLTSMALIFVLVGVVFGPAWFNVTPTYVNLLRGSFVAGGVGLFLSYYGQYWLILSQTHLDFKFLAIVRTSTSLLQVLPSIPLAWVTGNPLVLIVWNSVTAALQLAVLAWHGRKNYHLGFSLRHVRIKRAREMAAYTSKTFAALLVNSLLGAADRLVLGRLAPPADFAHYTISTNVGGRIQGLSTAVMGPVFSNTNRAVGNQNSVAAVYNETFEFVFPWYVLVSIWVAVWHPILLRLWLGAELGVSVEPLFTPIIVACCLTAIANISGAQLGSLNRVGGILFFAVLGAVLLISGVYVGWKWSGIYGVAMGFLFSRVAFIAQDLFTIRLIKAGGWRASRTWGQLGLQSAVGAGFWSVYLVIDRYSYWNLCLALLHGSLVGAWLLWVPVRRLIALAANGRKQGRNLA